jgi:putative Holliday junction resolvase
VGVAVSDALGMYAHPRPAIRTRSSQEAVRAVARLVDTEQVEEVVVGLPLTLEGKRGHQADVARSFVEALRAVLQVPVREVDERLSSAQAASARPELAGRRDGTLDSAAAAVVLQTVLDARRRGGQP